MKWISLIFIITIIGCDVVTDIAPEQTYVIITFDDQHESIYNIALPAMNDYGFKATNVINTAVVGRDEKLTWEQVEELEFEYGWETAGHTLHHITLTTTPMEIVEREIYQDWLNLIDHNLSHCTFALPSGKANIEHYDIILQYYDNVRTSMNCNTYAPVDRTDLGYYVYLTGYTAENVKARILRAIQNKECLITIGFHRFLDEADGHPTNCKPNDLYEILRFINDNELEVITIKEACELLSD